MEPTTITYRSLHRLPEDSEDLNNLTNTSRDFSQYLVKFSRPLIEFLGKKIQEKNICYLDCGAGEGAAIDSFLDSFGKSTKKCVGISLHYFWKVEKVLKKHRHKVVWHLGKAEEILVNYHNHFDLITDYFGAHFYSQERVKLLKLYHQCLMPGGKAFIFINHAKSVKRDRESLVDYLARKYPSTFYLDNNRMVLEITKSSRRCPPMNFQVSRLTYYASYQALNLSRDELEKGNAVYPEIELIKGPPRKRLRLLPFKRESQKSGKTDF